MCGLNGIFAYKASATLPRQSELIATRDHMRARGPDGCGEWWSQDRRLGLGHRRLSIVDLSDRALQPMASTDGRYHIVFNGEIYNYPLLRKELEAVGVHFRTTSDTEVLLHLYARDGAKMVHHLRGMFAFAIWDNSAERLFLARDPYGIKPLYVSHEDGVFRFASQVKALLAGGGISREVDPAGVVGFHLWGSVPEPFTVWRSIRALPAGACQTVDKNGVHQATRYCRLSEIFAEAAVSTSQGSLHDCAREALLDSVRAHLLADVEVGVFLSAGVDSGALLGLMRDAGQKRIRAVTLAFDEYVGSPNDEALIAAEVARRYGAEHIVRRISKAEFMADLPAILQAMDQPSIDGVNTWFVSKAAAEAGLKVALSGVGGDELFGGYPSFKQVPNMARCLRIPAAIPGIGSALRRIIGAVGIASSSPKISGLLEFGGTYTGAYLLRRGLFLPFELKGKIDDAVLREGLNVLQPIVHLQAEALTPQPSTASARVASLEACGYLRNQLLRDSDWAGMAIGLEIRMPLVDISLLRTLAPFISAFARERGKRSLAISPSIPLPLTVRNRRKTGFTVPTETWIAGQGIGVLPSKGAASRAWAQRVFGAQPAAS
jgi:asparagine synthase (glutamine-hydrolysing)